jgi:hypothetical protein
LDAELALGFWHVSHGVVQSELELQEPPVPLPLEVELEDVDRRWDEELVEVDRRREEELDRPQSAESVPVAQRLGSSQSPSLVYGQEAPQFELECEHEHVILLRRREEEVLTDPDPQSAFEQVRLHVELLVLDELRQALPAASTSQHAMPNGSSINTSKRLVPKNPFGFMPPKLCPMAQPL